MIMCKWRNKAVKIGSNLIKTNSNNISYSTWYLPHAHSPSLNLALGACGKSFMIRRGGPANVSDLSSGGRVVRGVDFPRSGDCWRWNRIVWGRFAVQIRVGCGTIVSGELTPALAHPLISPPISGEWSARQYFVSKLPNCVRRGRVLLSPDYYFFFSTIHCLLALLVNFRIGSDSDSLAPLGGGSLFGPISFYGVPDTRGLMALKSVTLHRS